MANIYISYISIYMFIYDQYIISFYIYIYYKYVPVQSLRHVQLFVSHMNCSPPGSSIHGIPQYRKLEWVAFSYSRDSSQLRNRTLLSCVSALGGRFFTTVPPGKPTVLQTTAYYTRCFLIALNHIS